MIIAMIKIYRYNCITIKIILLLIKRLVNFIKFNINLNHNNKLIFIRLIII